MANPKRHRPVGSLLLWITVSTLLAAPAAGDTAEGTGPAAGIAGQVLGEVAPLQSARVYLYHLADFRIDKVVTDEGGQFAFPNLPAGLYKVIAHKVGFVPSVVRLSRAAADAYQFVEVQLAPDAQGDVHAEEGFWAVRAEIPPDVLREITVDELASNGSTTRAGAYLAGGLKLATEVQAMTGIDRVAGIGSGQMMGGQLGVQGRVGDLHVGLRGAYRHLEATERATSSALVPGGQASTLSLNLSRGDHTQVSLTSMSNRLDPLDQQVATPVGFEHYRLSVSQSVGDRSRSEFAAQYTHESNFHRHGSTDPMGIPEASRSWRLEGSYMTLMGDTTTFKAGLRYRQREIEPGLGEDFGPLFGSTVGERVELFSRGGTQIQPTVLVEYGLYTTLLDGSLSLAPRGGVVVRLNDAWKASTTISHRLDEGSDAQLLDFLPSSFDQHEDCTQAEESCLRVMFTRTNEEQEEVSFGAIHREYAETLRLYFNDDFFHRLESLYLVPGDRLPEVQFALSRRLAPKVLTRLESNLASGGGGIYYAVDREPYENQVRYLVTSLDTRFQATSTGVFIALHHLQQELSSLSPAAGQASATIPLEVDRLQLMLTQDLNVLLGLAKDWVVQLNMELSRGSDPFQPLDDEDELYKSILGGIAVRF